MVIAESSLLWTYLQTAVFYMDQYNDTRTFSVIIIYASIKQGIWGVLGVCGVGGGGGLGGAGGEEKVGQGALYWSYTLSCCVPTHHSKSFAFLIVLLSLKGLFFFLKKNNNNKQTNKKNTKNTEHRVCGFTLCLAMSLAIVSRII